MAEILSALWPPFVESDRRNIYLLVWVDLEMSKKQAERIDALEKEVAELKDSLLQLSLRIAILSITTNVPVVQPAVNPNAIPCTPPYTPYVTPTIMYGNATTAESFWRD